MLTAGEIISTVLEVYVNPGSTGVDDDTQRRYQAAYCLRKRLAMACSMAPYWFREGNGTVSLSASAGYGEVPADFGSFGLHGQVYISGKQLGPLQPITPEELYALRQYTSGEATDPVAYCINGQSAVGRPYLQVYQTNSGAVTLLLKAYEKRVPFPVDRPGPPSAVEGATGLLSGAYTWKVTYVTADGETEAGPASSSLSVTLKKATVTVPVSRLREVTSRKVYRTIAGGTTEWKLVGTITDNVTTTYTDNAADGSLGAASPTLAAAVTGVEVIPQDFIETVLVEGLRNEFAGLMGDLRDAGWDQAWRREVKRMWAEQKRNRNFPTALPTYGSGGRGNSVRSIRWSIAQS